MSKTILRIVYLFGLASIAIVIDLFLYVFTKSCASCSSFGQFLASPLSIFAPISAAIVVALKRFDHEIGVLRFIRKISSSIKSKFL